MGSRCCYASASAWPKQHSPQGERSRISWSAAEDSGADICCPGSALAPVSLHPRSHARTYMRCIQSPTYEQRKAYTAKMAAKARYLVLAASLTNGQADRAAVWRKVEEKRLLFGEFC